MAKLSQKPQKSPIVLLNEKNANRCLCTGCPTFRSSRCPSEKNEMIYCSVGMTDCKLEQKGCICGDCQNFKEYGLKIGYFCAYGEAMQDGNPVRSQSQKR